MLCSIPSQTSTRIHTPPRLTPAPSTYQTEHSTLWERKIRTDKRRVQTPNMAQSSTDELRNLLNINEGSIGAFEAVANDLIG